MKEVYLVGKLVSGAPNNFSSEIHAGNVYGTLCGIACNYMWRVRGDEMSKTNCQECIDKLKEEEK